ncbi:AraC family transcriptional regulator [Streptomyces sp. NPDC048636]|uniref:AraC family transcriptional regulator n=1 Tax=Streptomyces sp. NPDC048636 TaxID=3155762 RepID=UPI0034376050
MNVVGIRDYQRPAKKEIIALPDQVCITPPEQERTVIVRSVENRTTTLASLTVPVEWFSHLSEDGGDEPSTSELQRLRAEGRTDPVLAAVVKATLTAHEAGADDLYAGSAAQFIAAHLTAPRAANDTKPAGPLGQGQLDTVISYMRENITDPITLDDLSSLISYSRSHFARCFKATTGCTPYRYLTNMRIDMARGYLESGGDTILHISRRCGFSDSRNFVRSFHRTTGCTPSEYRSARA